ncbi:cilia- and flagella-associated protein 57-like [Centruroides vittatus]|uniref:cilia- and flagella-associated protein 57-like n=1 Tax=Centruroides vittatus TaxID=120091 RepID=UPI00350F1247
MEMALPKLHSIIGFRCDIENAIHFLSEDTLLYPAGNVYVLHNIQNNTQKFLKDNKLNKAFYAALDSESKLLALLIPGKRRAFVALFNLSTLERVASLSYDRMTSKTMVCFCFSPDGRHVLAQTGPPDWQMILWDWNKNDIICVYEPLNLKKDCEIFQVTFHPKDFSQVCSVGKKTLRTYRISGGNFKQFIFQRYEEEEVNYLCHVWFSKSKIAIGSNDGRILVIENNEEVDEILVTDEYCQDPNKGGLARRQLLERVLNDVNPINRLVATDKRILALCGHRLVAVYEIEKATIKHIPLGVIELPSNEMEEDEDEKITNLIVNPKGKLVVINTNQGRLCSFAFETEEWEKCFREKFLNFLQPNLVGGIRDLDVCIQKQLVAFCTPNFFHFWDYKKQKLELRQFIHQELFSMSVHPSGNYVVAGCGDKLRFFAVFLNELRTLKEYPIRESDQCSFSEGGHLFACTSGYVICIYSTITLDIIAKLKGHFGAVRSILWTEADTSILSCAEDGAFYKWNVQSGTRVQDIVERSCNYYAMFVAENGNVYITCSDKTIKELKNFKNSRSIECNTLVTSCIPSLCNKKIYLGTSEGNLRMEAQPLQEILEGEEHMAHLGEVTKMKLSYDGTLLASSGADGTLCFWQVEHEAQPETVLFTATFTTKEEVQEQIEKIDQLQNYIEELRIDRAYQLRKKSEQNDKYIANLSKKFTEDIDNLKKEIEKLIEGISEMKKKHELEIVDLEEKHRKDFEKQEEEHRGKLIVQYERIEKIQNQSKYELQDVKERSEKTMNDLQEVSRRKCEDYEKKLKKYEEELKEIKEIRQEEERTWQLYIDEKEQELNEEIIKMKADYDKQLKTRKESLLLYRTELNIMKSRIASLKSEIEHNRIHNEKQEQEIGSLKDVIEDLIKKEDVYKNEIDYRNKSIILRVI